MSSTRKGDAFEAVAIRRIRASIKRGDWGLDPRHITIRRKPRYFSADRDQDIQFDISFELRMKPGTPAIVVFVVECKDVGRSVSVDDLEEFKGKLDQCFRKNVKGVFATPANLQSGALRYAQANGIAVLRILPGKQIGVRAYKLVPGIGPAVIMASNRKELIRCVDRALTSRDFHSFRDFTGTYDVFGTIGKKRHIDLSEFLLQLTSRARTRQLGEALGRELAGN
jgi:hypothetical protein